VITDTELEASGVAGSILERAELVAPVHIEIPDDAGAGEEIVSEPRQTERGVHRRRQRRH
jgi:hypothetical protein